MNNIFLGAEVTHHPTHRRTQLLISKRPGKIKRWVDKKKPTVINGFLRERFGMMLPSGFRFQRDLIKEALRTHDSFSWADAKCYIAQGVATGVYRAHEKTTESIEEETISAKD